MSSFYSTDGALGLDSPSYVERPADKELLDTLLSGEFCSVLSPRHTGKSSLMIRTAAKLRERGVHVVMLNLAEFVGPTEPDVWCRDVLAGVGRQLQLDRELDGFWKRHTLVSPFRRWFAALREVVLPKLKDRDGESARARKDARSLPSLSEYHASPGRCVVFFDEIAAARLLPFVTEDFFHEMKECSQRRTEDPEFNRLCFCLLGVAAPVAPSRPPHDPSLRIGRLLDLPDFTADQGAILASGLKAEPIPAPETPAPESARPRIQIQNVNSERILLERVFYWTEGHPYLTQRLCQALHELLTKPVSGQSSLATREWVDQQCEQLFFSRQGREHDPNLRFVKEALLSQGGERSNLLEYGAEIGHPNFLASRDDSAPLTALLRQSGLVGVAPGALRFRNRIYARVFDRSWFISQMPEAELRRQRAAHRRGVTRAAAVGAILFLITAALAAIAFRQGRAASAEAERNGRQARENRDRLVQLTVANGARLLDQGAVMGSLPWFAEAMNLVEADPVQEEMHRFRLHALLRRCPRLIHAFAHEQKVQHVEFSPDGRWLLTAAADQTAQVWDLISGERLTPPLKHGGPVARAAFNREGSRIVTACADGTAHLWETATGRELTPPWRHQGAVLAARFSPDGEQVVTAGADGMVRVWKASTGEPITPLMVHPGPVHDAVFSLDGRRVATASSGNSGRIWDAATGQPVTPPLPHAGPVTSIAFSPDDRKVVTASQDGTARIWDAVTGAAKTAPLKHDGPVSRARFSPEGETVVTASLDHSVHVWSSVTGESIGRPLAHAHAVGDVDFSPDGRRVLTIHASFAEVWDAAAGLPALPALEHGATVTSAAFSLDGSRVVTACEDGAIRIWNIAGALMDTLVVPHKSAVHFATFSPDNQKLLTASGDGVAQVWDAGSGRGLAQRLVHGGYVYQALFHPQGHRILTLCEDGAARIVEDTAGALVGKPVEHESPIHHAAFSPDGAWYATASSDHTARVWNASTGAPVTPPLRHENNVTDISFSPAGNKLLTASWDQTVRVWDPSNGRELRPTLKLNEPVNEAVFSYDARRIATASGNEARIWDAGQGQPLTPPIRHDGRITSVAFSPDNRYVLTAGWDHRARVWSAVTGLPITPWLVHRQPIARAIFSPDGLRVATASWDGTAMIWDAFTGQSVTLPMRHGGPVTWLSFSTDGHRLVTGGQDQTARVWILPSEERPPASLASWAQLTAGAKVEASGAALPLDRLALRDGLSKLRSKYPTDLGLADEQTLAWHNVEASRAETEGDWFAAAFHLERLAAALPQDKALRNRQSSAKVEFTRAAQRRRLTIPVEKGSPRDPRAEPGQVDLSDYYTNPAVEGKWREVAAVLPQGLQLLAGTPFDVRGVIVLASESSSPQSAPERVVGIRVARQCQRLHFLQATAGGTGLAEGTVVGSYVVHFADGQKREIPLRYGDDVADWRISTEAPLEIKGSVVAWTGAAPPREEAGQFLRLFKTSLENPLPELVITAIDFGSAKTAAAPVLMALTTEP